MIWLKTTAVVLAALLLQLTVFVDVRIAGVAPELMVLVAVLAGISAGAARGSVIAFFVGLTWDLYLATPLGLSAASFALAAYAVGGFEISLAVPLLIISCFSESLLQRTKVNKFWQLTKSMVLTECQCAVIACFAM